MENIETVNRDVLINAKYIIKFFNDKNNSVTNLKLQKLLYFLEAIYMVYTDDVKLYDDEFYAWDFGPVNEIIYNEYKIFGNTPIILEEEVLINEENKKYIEYLYNIFGSFSAFDLVTISHSEGSPWYNINKKYNDNIPHKTVIRKQDTKEWFKRIIREEDSKRK